MLEKPGAQNIAVCENKQREFSGHWRSIITLFLKKIMDDAKKTKKLTEIQVLTKDSAS